MRKYLSVLLTLCVLLSTVFILPFSASADEIIEPSVRTLTNTYDEDGAVYKSYKTVIDAETSETSVVEISDTDTFDNESAYTVRTYNEKDVQLTAYDAVIKPYEEGNYSAFIGVHQNGITSSTSGYPNTLWIYDSTDANLGLFVPKTYTTYKIKFNYRSDGTDYGKSIFLSLARKSSETGNVYSSDYAYIEEMVYISEQSTDWLTAEATFTTGSEVSALYLALHSDSDWWNEDVNLWVDNIEITEYTTGNATYMDFEEEQGTFIENNPVTNISKSITYLADSGDTTHGNVVKFGKLRVYRADGASKWNTYLEPSMFLISDKLGNAPMRYEKGQFIDVSFQMKKNSDISEEYFTEFTAALVFDESYDSTGASNSINDYVENGKAVTLATVSNKADEDWVTYTATVKVPNSGYAAFLLYGVTWNVSCDIYVDNLSVSPVPQIKETVIDFEDKQFTYQAENIVSSHGAVIETETVQGAVYQVNRVQAYKPNNSTYNAAHWINNYNPGFIITEPDGIYPAEYNAGDMLSLSFKIKKNTTFAETDKTKAIYTSMVFGLDADTAVSDANIGSTVTLKDNGNLVDLVALDLTTDEDFVTYTAKVVVPTDGNAAFMLYVDDWYYTCDIYVDDVEISLLKETTVDFNDAQTSYITENPVGYNYEIIASEDKGHGNVMNFKRIVAQKSINYTGNIWNAGSPAAFSVLDTEGKGVLWYEAGDELTVSVQIKKPAEIVSDDFDEFYAALTFVDNSNTYVKEYIATLINENRVVKVATLDKAASDWVTYTTTITVPHDGYAVFMVYAPEWFVDTSVLVDNLVIEEFDVATLNRNGDVNGDGVVDVRDLVRIKKMASGAADTDIIADIDFDGVVAGAGDLTKLRKFILATDTAVPYTKDGRTLVWNEEFEYANTMNTNLSFTRSMDNSDDAEALGYTVEYVNASNHTVENGNLNLSVGKTDTGYSVCEGITTKGHMFFKYGYLEMRAKVPFSAGAWPSLWLLGNTPYHDSTAEWFAEVDIFEVFSSTDTLSVNIHKHGGQGQGVSEQLGVFNSDLNRKYTFENAENLSNEYHIYGFEWNETQMKFYVDGECFFTFNYSDFDDSNLYDGIEGFKEFMYIQLNSEVLTSVLTGTEEVNADYSIDYLRIYQNAANGEEIIY